MAGRNLAEYISDIREKRGFSQTGLAKAANLDLKIIEEIESGQMLFLSTVVRQKIARVLKIEPKILKHLEKEINTDKISTEYIEELKIRILNGEKEINCPVCKNPLSVRIAKMYDLEDNLVLHPKATCTKCPFQIT